MTDTTRAAVIALCQALTTDPDGAAELDVYGNIVEHLSDWLHDEEGGDDDE